MAAKVIKTRREYDDDLDCSWYKCTTHVTIVGNFWARFKRPKTIVNLQYNSKASNDAYPASDPITWLLDVVTDRVDLKFVNDWEGEKNSQGLWSSSLVNFEAKFSSPKDAVMFKLVWGGQ